MAKLTSMSMFLGEDREVIFTILNKAETEAVDISGWGLSFMVKKRADDTDANALIVQTTASQITVSGAWDPDPDVSAQVATLSLFAGDTSALQAGQAHYELIRTDNGTRVVLAYGPFNLTRGVHRS